MLEGQRKGLEGGGHLNKVVKVRTPPTASTSLHGSNSGSSPKTHRSAFWGSMGGPGGPCIPPPNSRKSHGQPPPAKAFQNLTPSFTNTADISPCQSKRE